MTPDTKCQLGFRRPIKALVIGGKGGVGDALATLIATDCPGSLVISTSRDPRWVGQTPSHVNMARMQLDLTDDKSTFARPSPYVK